MKNNSFVIGLPEAMSRETDQITGSGTFVWTTSQETANLLTAGGHEKVIHTQTNLYLKAAGLFKYIWSFNGKKALQSGNLNCTLRTICYSNQIYTGFGGGLNYL